MRVSARRIRLVVATLLVAVVALSSLSTYLYLASTTQHEISISSTSWHAVWRSNGTAAPIPGVGSDFLGTCWNLSGLWPAGRLVDCDLQFDSGAFGPVPPSSVWSAVDNVSISPPFQLRQMSVGYFGDQVIETTVVLTILMPESGGPYGFSGEVTVSP